MQVHKCKQNTIVKPPCRCGLLVISLHTKWSAFFFFIFRRNSAFLQLVALLCLGKIKWKFLQLRYMYSMYGIGDKFKFLREVEWLQLTSILFSIFSQKDSAPWTSSSPKTAQFWSPQMWLAGAWTFHMWMLLLILIYQHIPRYKHAYNV